MFSRQFFSNLFTAFLLFTTLATQAQWVTNTAVNTLVANQNTEDIQSVISNDGYTYVAFWHSVPAPQYYEMRLQKLDTNGTQLFGANGMLVNSSITMSSYTVTWDVAIDDSNQVYIGITGTGTGNPAVVHKISPTGAQLWGAAGVTIGSGYDVKILPLSNGQVVISFLPGLHAQFRKYSANGVAMWTNAVTVTPSVSTYRSIVGEMIEISGNKFEVIYYEQAGFSPYGLPFAKCYGFGGIAQWTGPKALTSGVYVQTNRRYSVTSADDTVYFGFAGSIGLNIQSYIQRINPNGTTPWGTNGVDFATQSAMYERDVRIAVEEGSNYIWAIAEFTPSNQANVGEYVQKIHKTSGARMLGANALQVFAVGPLDRSHQGALRVYQNRPFFLVTDGVSNGVFPKDIWLIHLDTLGVLNPLTGIIPMATNPLGVKSRINLVKIVQDDAIAVWAENRSGSTQPYAQKHALTPCVFPVSMFYASTNNLTVTLSSSTNTADSVYWDFGDGSSLSDTSLLINHTYNAAGNYTVCKLVFNACGSDTLCQTVTVCTPLSAQFTYTAWADSVFFTCGWAFGDSLFWDFGDGSTLSTVGATVSHTYAANGTYTVKLYAANNCTADSAWQSVVITGIGMLEEDADKNNSSLWPNPACEILYCKTPAFLAAKDIGISFYNPAGALVLRFFKADVKSGEVLSIPVHQLTPGVYVVKFSWQAASARILIGK